MADYAQNGVIGTLHNLRNKSTEQLEAELTGFSKDLPMTLLLPCLFSEMEGPAMGPIVDQLSLAGYLDEIIIGLDRANEEQFRQARQFFSRLPQKHTIL
jgi:glucosyl-3-phosphoglycerate synthase